MTRVGNRTCGVALMVVCTLAGCSWGQGDEQPEDEGLESLWGDVEALSDLELFVPDNLGVTLTVEEDIVVLIPCTVGPWGAIYFGPADLSSTTWSASLPPGPRETFVREVQLGVAPPGWKP